MPLATAKADHTMPLILIIEDDPFIALALEETLQHEGYHVLAPAASVSSALALLQHSDPDAAVLDVNLGRNKVTPVATALADSHVPFVLVSGDTQPFVDDVLASACNLGKPTHKAALLNELERMLSKAALN